MHNRQMHMPSLPFPPTIRQRVEAWPLRLAFYCCFGLGASAAGAAPRAEVDPCARSRNEATLLTCRQQQAAQSTQRIEQLLERLRRRDETDEPERWQLQVASQADWRQYRDAECRVRTFESRAGKAYETYRLACVALLNRLRADDLHKQVDNP